MQHSKKGYIFVVDVLIAISILALTFFLLFNFYSTPLSDKQKELIASDVIDFLLETKIQTYANDPKIQTIIRNASTFCPKIHDLRNSFADEMVLNAADCWSQFTDPSTELVEVFLDNINIDKSRIVVNVSLVENSFVRMVYPDPANITYAQIKDEQKESSSYFVKRQALYVERVDNNVDAKVVGPAIISVEIW